MHGKRAARLAFGHLGRNKSGCLIINGFCLSTMDDRVRGKIDFFPRGGKVPKIQGLAFFGHYAFKIPIFWQALHGKVICPPKAESSTEKLFCTEVQCTNMT